MHRRIVALTAIVTMTSTMLPSRLAPTAEAAVTHTRSPVGADYIGLSEELFIYGLPLVLMDATARASTRFAPMNTFAHARTAPGPSEATLIRPVADSLYSTAWLDLSRGPIVLHLPAATDRFFLVQFLDAYTNVIASARSDALSTPTHDFAVVGPHWRGSLPPTVNRIDAPSNTVWITARTHFEGANDAAGARRFMAQYTLQSLTDFVARRPPTPGRFVDGLRGSGDGSLPLPDEVARMDGVTFARKLARLTSTHPPPEQDASELHRLEAIGFRPGQPFDPNDAVVEALRDVPARLLQTGGEIASESRRIGIVHDGWAYPPSNLGTYYTDYRTRALVAYAYLGAGRTADVVVPSTRVDRDGEPLVGRHRYVLHFARGETPPVHASWSITLYDDKGHFVPNAIDRFMLRDRESLARNPDGSLDLVFATERPAETPESNWLPAPTGPFSLVVRMDAPTREAAEGRYRLPPVVRVDERAARR